jgi:hypothetical protein
MTQKFLIQIKGTATNGKVIDPDMIRRCIDMLLYGRYSELEITEINEDLKE